MSLRDKLKNTKKPELAPEDAFIFDESPPWFTGTDLPFTWDAKGLKQCSKNTLRANLKRGYFTKKQYKQKLKEL